MPIKTAIKTEKYIKNGIINSINPKGNIIEMINN